MKKERNGDENLTKKIERLNGGDGFRKLGIIIPSLPPLIFRFGRVFLKFKSEAKKSGKIFKKELIGRGLDETTAVAFTNMYLESSSLTHYMDFLR